MSLKRTLRRTTTNNLPTLKSTSSQAVLAATQQNRISYPPRRISGGQQGCFPNRRISGGQQQGCLPKRNGSCGGKHKLGNSCSSADILSPAPPGLLSNNRRISAGEQGCFAKRKTSRPRKESVDRKQILVLSNSVA